MCQPVMVTLRGNNGDVPLDVVYAFSHGIKKLQGQDFMGLMIKSYFIEHCISGAPIFHTFIFDLMMCGLLTPKGDVSEDMKKVVRAAHVMNGSMYMQVDPVLKEEPQKG